MDEHPSTQLRFWDHIEELRTFIGIALGSCVGLYFGTDLVNFITMPFRENASSQAHMTVLSPMEGFNIYLEVGIWGGVILALPWVFYQLWRFVAPGLYKTERRMVYVLIFASTGLFLMGVGLTWWMLPYGIKWLSEFSNGNSEIFWSLEHYVNFVVLLALAFGICFQLPLVMALLIRLGLVPPSIFRKYRRIAYVIIAVVAAVVTPTADMFTMAAMMVPLMILYEISLLFGSIWHRRSQRVEPLDQA